MKDKDIRDILLAYIKASYPEVRIYQEKSIGSSICDVMAVTNQLIGFEIKSDSDNYERIERQVAAYDNFFRRNYIVVGKTHEKSAIEKVPAHWGVLVIENDHITVLREADKNRKVKIDRQLSILWLLELKNILNYFNLPMFAQKTKGYIQDRLVESVPHDQLEQQIVYELMNRDYSVYNATDYSEYSKQDSVMQSITNIKAMNLMDDISEMEFADMTLAQWIEIYHNAQKLKKAKEEIISIPLERARHAITWEDIEVSLGVPWVSKEIIEDFIYYVKYGNRLDRQTWRTAVFYEEITGNWQVANKGEGDSLPRCYSEYGTVGYNALWIIEASLNLREIRLYDRVHKYDEGRTMAAIEKQKVIHELFNKWIWEDEDRKWAVEEAYNKLFGQFKNEHFDGSKLSFPGLNDKYELFDYQKDAVQRIISTPNTLLAFDVGAGKTFIMITAAMLMREQGLSRKNMFVVPNNIVGQWEKIFSDLYPKAKLLVVEPKNYKKPLRQKILKQIMNGDYDGIIMAYSCFEEIPLSKERLLKRTNDKIAELDAAIKDYPVVYGGVYNQNNGFINRKLREKKESICGIMREILWELDKPIEAEPDITFEQLEINTIFLDEAHNYKNLTLDTKMKNIRGINIKGSAKCTDMLEKIRSVQEMNQGRGAVFATGTPLCNSLVDAYTMQMYLQHETLKEMHLDVFDNWVKTFARPERVAEVDVDSQHFRYITRFSKFFNLPELSKMFGQIAIFHAMEKEDGIPELEGYTDCVIENNHDLKEYMHSLLKRTEEIRSGKIDRKWDNMLKVSTDGRKAALDLRLVGNVQSKETSKITKCVAKVMKIYSDCPGSTQLIFCDYSTPKPGEFNVYKELKQSLIERGIPETEIAFIHSYHTEARKVKLFSDVNAGIIRILLGSTFKLGIGANVQQRLKAIHHLDVPWRPADMVQREGRILRKGNTNAEVSIFRYICEGSFDAYSWQILEGKQKFISQFLTGTTYQRSASDLEENVLDYAEVKALALADPRMRDLAEMENDLASLYIVSRKWNENQAAIDAKRNQIITSINVLSQQIAGAKTIRTIVGEKHDTDYREIKQILAESLTHERILSSKSRLAEFWGVSITVPENNNVEKPYFFIKVDEARFRIESGGSGEGNATRVTNFLKKIDKKLADFEETLAEKKKLLAEIQEETISTNPYREKIDELNHRIKKLKKEIVLDGAKKNAH